MNSPVVIGDATLYLGDCMDYMRGLPDKAFELAIVDPPYFSEIAKESFYGSPISKTGIARFRSTSKHWEIPSEAYFKELLRVSANQIIWGCNYYAEHIPYVGRLVWDKKNDTSTYSNCELASQSFSLGVFIFRHEWNGMLQEDMKNKEQRIHPTQKPIKLYEWLLTNYAKQGDRILDTHGGSMSSVIACLNLGFAVTCCELDPDYFATACERVRNSQRQQPMFAPERPKQIQEALV